MPNILAPKAKNAALNILAAAADERSMGLAVGRGRRAAVGMDDLGG